MDNNQKILCTVESCKFNDCNHSVCELKQIEVQACPGCSNEKAEYESMCGSYSCRS